MLIASNILEIVYCVVLLVSGTILFIQDWRNFSVSPFWLLLFSLASLYHYCIYREYSLLLFVILVFCAVVFKIFLGKNAFGFADYLVSVAVSPLLNNNDIPNLLILLGIFGITATISSKNIRKKTIIPFVSVLLISVLFLKVCKTFK